MDRDIRRKIVCLCGSTKFKKEFEDAEAVFTLAGYIVLTVGVFCHADNISLTVEQKKDLDKLHLDKIRISDEIYIINVGGYVGESTRKEIAFANSLGICVRYREPLANVAFGETHG